LFGKIFKGFLGVLDFSYVFGFSVQDRTQNYDATQEHPIYTILSVTSFSINYDKTHKSRLKCKIKIKIVPQSKNRKTKIWTFEFFISFRFKKTL